MDPLFVVARKEIKQILKNKSLIIGVIFFMGIFGGITSMGAVMSAAEGSSGVITSSLDSLIVYLILVMGIFTGYFFSSQAFLREKTDGTIETILCSPLSLREVWLGKVIGVTVPAYIVSLVIAVILVAAANFGSGYLVLPSPAMILYLLIVVPVYIGCATGLLGFVQLLLGMRENQIVNFVMIFGFIVAISFFESMIADNAITVSFLLVIEMAAAGVILMGIVRYLTGFLSREKIVTTIP
ncbi:ABC-2 type transport system permease protein [Methanomicrobium sp. W14]|uniref:ABC transporter permease n=1 Tax=Methanomicrobium sp. W14 TaxID=2817839 RepID=UPI001AE6FEEA|nr:ABC transporter permease [Methanomicrobium sp. W14]MBP2133552.1 ABC-2 type transport system permease protein [Methanomicrobium sp. W14]